jgi:hypothetical protein
MKGASTKALLFLLMLLVSPLGLYAWHEEILFGTYSHQSKDLSIRFSWDLEGISQLEINGRRYVGVSDDNLGVHGNTAFYRIGIEQTERTLKFLDLLIFYQENKVVLVSGFFADLELSGSQKNDFKVRFAKAIELKFKPLSKVKSQIENKDM